MKSLNDKDKRILAMLMENPRRSYKEIAEDLKVNLSESKRNYNEKLTFLGYP